MNVDGSDLRVPRRGGFKGRVRSHRCGEWIAGYYGHLSDPDILHLELLDIFHGLSLTRNLGGVVECQSDSQNAVDLVLAICAFVTTYLRGAHMRH